MEGTNTTPAPASNTQPQGQSDANITVQSTQTTSATGDVPSAVKEAAQEAIRKHKLKIDGQEVEVDDNELKREYSLKKASAKKITEAVRMRKQAEEFINAIKDPERILDILQQAGHDHATLRKISEGYLASVLSEELLDPKDRELNQTKRELEALRQEREAEQKRREDHVRNQLKQKYIKEYNEQFVNAIQKAGLPADNSSVKAMAGYIYRASEIGLKMTPEEAASLVKQDKEADLKSTFSKADAETVVKLLGEDVANKIRQWDTSRVKDPLAKLENPSAPTEPREKRDPTKRMTHQEWRKFNRN